jgi:hypothetical protein
MTIDSSVVQKNYQKPDIVRARPKRLVFLNAEGDIIVQEDVPPPPDDSVNVQTGGGVLPPPDTNKEDNKDEKVTEDQKFGGTLFTGGLLLAGYIVFNILTKK